MQGGDGIGQLGLGGDRHADAAKDLFQIRARCGETGGAGGQDRDRTLRSAPWQHPAAQAIPCAPAGDQRCIRWAAGRINNLCAMGFCQIAGDCPRWQVAIAQQYIAQRHIQTQRRSSGTVGLSLIQQMPGQQGLQQRHIRIGQAGGNSGIGDEIKHMAPVP